MNTYLGIIVSPGYGVLADSHFSLAYANPMKPFQLSLLCVAASALVSVYSSGEVHAKPVICDHVQADLFSVDGLDDDWQSIRSVRYGTKGGSMKLRCAYDDKHLYLMMNAVDDRLVRSKRASARKEDHIKLSIGVRGGKAIQGIIFPGAGRVSRKVVGMPKFVSVEDSLQKGGFSVEVGIPLRKMTRWSSTVPYLDAKVQFADADAGGRKKTVGMRGKMHFSDAVSTYRAFMRQTGLRNRQLRLDKLADVDAGQGPERILIGGKVMGVLGTSYTYTGLPIASARDLLSARVVDFDGSGRSMILTELRQHGNGGSRDVVVVWTIAENGNLQQVLTVETRKELGASTMENSWSLVPRGKHRDRGRTSRGYDILVMSGEVSGFSEANYREAPAVDAKPVLTPWGSQQSAVYYFEGTQVYGGQAGVKLPKSR